MGREKGISRCSLVLGVACLMLGALPAGAAAATIDVEIRTDELIDNGNCSLREAAQAANLDNAAAQTEAGCTAGNGADVITLHAGDPYTLTTAIDGTPDINDGDLELTDPDGVTVLGEGQATTIVDGGDQDRIFEAVAGALTINAVTVRNGMVTTTSGGGGILSASSVTLIDAGVVESQQTASTGNGGGGIALSDGGSLTASGDSHIDDNLSANFGGGVSKLNDGDIALNPGVTVDGNSAVGFGGGLFVSGNATALLVDGASVSDNSLTEDTLQRAIGSAISYGSNAAVQITDAAINGNDAIADHAGPAVDLFSSVPALIDSSTISDNTATGQDDTGGDVLGPAGFSSNDNAGATIANSTVSSNSVIGVDNEDAILGGGISAITPLTITGSTIALNSVSSGLASSRTGAGLYVDFNTTGVGVLNSTFTGNDANGGTGGAISLALNGQLTVGQSTFSGNMAPQGSGINTQGGATSTLIMRGLIFVQGATACSFGGGGTVTADAFNVDTDTSCVGVTDDTDYENTLASLGALADNGGPTETKALFGPVNLFNGAVACTQLDGSTPLTVDQRGAPRPTDGGCEPGAYERFLCNGVLVNTPGPFPGCPAPPVPPVTPPLTTVPTTAPNPLCAALRKKLKAAKKAGNRAKARKIRRKLRRLGC